MIPLPVNRGLIARYIGGLSMRGVEVVGKLALYILAARHLGTHDSGLFFLTLSWVGVAATVFRLGLDRALTRHLAAEFAVGAGARAQADLRRAFLFAALLAALAAGLLWVLAGPIAVHLFRQPELAAPFAQGGLLLLPMTLSIMLGAALAGLKRNIAAQLVQNAAWPALTVLALALHGGGLAWLMWSLIAATWAACLIGAAWLWRVRGVFEAVPQPKAPAAEALPGLWRTSLPLCVVEVVQVGLSGLPVIVLGMVASPSEVGAFSIANRISMLIWMVIVSVGIMASPHFAELHRLGARAQLARFNRLTRWGVLALGVPAIAAMLAAPEPLLALIGPGFAIAAAPLRILALGQLVNCLIPCQDVILAMTGQGEVLRRLNLLQGAVGLVLAAILVPAFGAVGAAVMAALSLAQGAIGTGWMVARLMPEIALWPRGAAERTQA